MRTIKEALEDGSISLEDEIDYPDMTEEEYKEEIERLNNIIEKIRECVKHKIVECYDEGSTIGEFYKICDIDSKIEELLHKGSNKDATK